MNDTTRRFLDDVLARVPESRIVEVRLFPAIRQGGIESGVAVLAVHPEPPLPFPEASGSFDGEGDESLFDPAGAAALRGETPVDLVAVVDAAPAGDDAPDVFRAAPTPPSAFAHADPVVANTDQASALAVTADGMEGRVGAVEESIDPSGGETPVALPPTGNDRAPRDEDPGIALGDILALPAPARGAVGPDRLAILCARYRLLIKGPDRGKWDLEIVHQADAPLDTLDRVIQGVVRRSGDDAEPERFTRQSLREYLDAPAWASGG